MYTAHPGSGLGRLGGADAPFWAFPWSGGAALARHLLDNPASVAGRRVLDLGAGGGLVAIAAAKAGAVDVVAAETDPFGIVATQLNAAANGVSVLSLGRDLLAEPPPSAEVILVGDLFYESGLADRVSAFLDICALAGIEALVGDPGRIHLPRSRLQLLSQHRPAGMGRLDDDEALSGVFAWR